MTVSTVPRVAGPFNGNGVTTSFPFEFKVFTKADVALVHTDAEGTQTTMVLDSDYSISLNPDQGANPGGSVTYPLSGDPLPSGESLAVVGDMEYEQSTAIASLGTFSLAVIEATFDKVVILIQQLRERLLRTIAAPVGESADLTLPAAADRANRTLVFDSGGNATVAATPESVQEVLDETIVHKDAAAASAGLSQEWATKTSGAVDGTDYSAKQHALDAETDRIAAESARDAALIQAGVYVDEATGRAAVSNGQAFKVQGSGDVAAYEYRRVDASNSTLIATYASLASLNTLRSTPVPDVEHAIQDSNDNASEYIEPTTGTHHFLAVETGEINGISRQRLAIVCRSSVNLTATYVAHISYGQSLSLGNGSDLHTLPSVGDGFFDCLMFNANGTASAGPRAQEGSGTTAQNHASFVAYEERPVSGSSPTGNFETPLGNALRMIKRLLRDEDGIAPSDYDYFLVGSAPGQGNTAIAGLVKGQTPYNRLIDDVTYGLANANAAGGSYAVDVVYWSQGERDVTLGTARATYKAALLQLYADLNTDIKALTGQGHDIKLVMYQISEYDQTNPNIALAQLDAAKENANIVLATSVYAVEHLSASNVHLTGFGYAHLGAYYGLAAKRVVVDGETWANLYPSRLTRQGTILDVEFPDTGYPLAISDALFATQTNAGFTAVGTDGTTDNPITNVEVVAPRRVRITLTNAAAGYLRYGFASWGGNLHDTCDIDPGTAREIPLYRPCLTFEESFA